MALFGGKNYSNPAVGRFHQRAQGMDREESTLTKGKSMGAGKVETAGGGGGTPRHSIHGYFHQDGTAHTHIAHPDGTHEHADHATHEEAKDQLTSAMQGGDDQGPELGDWAEEEKAEPQHMTIHGATRAGGGAF